MRGKGAGGAVRKVLTGIAGSGLRAAALRNERRMGRQAVDHLDDVTAHARKTPGDIGRIASIRQRLIALWNNTLAQQDSP